MSVLKKIIKKFIKILTKRFWHLYSRMLLHSEYLKTWTRKVAIVILLFNL